MSALAIAALVLVSAWIGVLTLVVVLLVRQVGLLTVRLSAAGQAISVENDGPEVGDRIPENVAAALPDLREDRAHLLLVSSTCDPCRELVADISDRRFDGDNIVALVPGEGEQAADFAGLFPSGIRTVGDPEATELAGLLGIESTPFALEVERGTVTKKAYLFDGAADLMRFVGDEEGLAEAPARSFVEISRKGTIEGR